jgi:D-inositol-3-phosphate glycosyltransferase
MSEAGLRVLYTFPHPLGRPGIATTAWNQIWGLQRAGVDTYVSCTSVARPLESTAALRQSLVVLGRRVPHRALGYERALAWHDWRTARWLRELAGRIDLVHCWPRAGLRTMRMAHEIGVPVLRESPNCHTAFACEVVARECQQLGIAPPPGHSHSFDAARLSIEEAEFDTASGILVPSDFVQKTFLDRGFDRSKLARHRYGYDPTRFSARGRKDRSTNDPLSVAFVGSGEPRKGLHLALQAWCDAGAAEAGGSFRICGSIQPDYRRVLAPRLAHPSVRELGFVGDPGAVLREVDALILPSLEEGSALVTYEALASGCLLLVSDAAGAPCEHDRNGLLHPAGDVAALTAHIRKLHEHRSEIQRLQLSGRETLEELTWEASGRRLREIYSDYVEARRRSPASAA